MNEAIMDDPFARSGILVRVLGTAETRKSGAFYGYSLLTMALGVGWLLRERNLVSAADGLGYWLGIVGGLMMLLLLLYPVRKRFRSLRFIGSTAGWFRLHMILGLLGPMLVLFHSNFQIGSFNSQVALLCMLLVAGSGIIGRHLYAGIHQGLYGQKSNLAELHGTLAESLEHSSGLAALAPKLATRLTSLTTEIQGDGIAHAMSLGGSINWLLRRHLLQFSLLRGARIELIARATCIPAVARDLPRLRTASATFVRKFMRHATKIARFTLYERLFSLWHVLHLPLFFMLIISALVHVLAVHMY
ncbi:MAG: hypothetical protein KJO31_00390 [Gammaproteobacteria bacterium]|nr:hypothetical protein [Gammaproteobacteria bacterium]